MNDYIRIDDKDNVVIALNDFKKGSVINVDSKIINIKEDVKAGHKIALEDIDKGEDVIKYGYSIGHANYNIKSGQWVHTHNIRTNLNGVIQYSYNKKNEFKSQPNRGITFNGYIRKNGDVGIRNELWIIPTVGCVNGVADNIISRFKEKLMDDELVKSDVIISKKIKGIDNIEVFKHNYGCSQLGDDHINTRKILGDIAKHPNAGGVLVLGLGCENNEINEFKKSLGEYDCERIKFLVAQDVSDEIEEGARILSDLYNNMKDDKREAVSISKLKIGLKCGGSDGLSGITANPLIGRFSDFLVSQGGTTILTEVLAKAGANIAIVNRNILDEVIEEITSYCVKCKGYELDLCKFDEYDNVISDIINDMGKIDILVNNAGVQKRHPSTEFPKEDWNFVMDVNCDAVFFMSQKVGKIMIEKGYGKIINMASLLSFQGGLTVPAYAAAKGAVMQFTKSLSNEWAKLGVNVNCIAPGYMDTDMNTALINDKNRSKQILERIPAGRWGNPEDIAGTAVFLASQASDYINGFTIAVDGGWLGR